MSILLGLVVVGTTIGLGCLLNWLEFGEAYTKFWEDTDGA
jgi:hypothetical protein